MPLVLECEWGSCQDTFGRMENLCKHMETHLGTSDPSEDSDENEGQGNDRSMDETYCETFTWSQWSSYLVLCECLNFQPSRAAFGDIVDSAR